MSSHLFPENLNWISSLPDGWTLVRLKFLVNEMVSGGTPATGSPEYWNGNIPWVSPKDMKRSLVSATLDNVTNLAVDETRLSVIEPDHVMVVVRSGILRHTIPVARNAKPVTINQDIIALKLGSRLRPNFLQYVVEGCQGALLARWRKPGTTVESLEYEYYANDELPVPPLPEQRAIAAFLDRETARIDGLIERKRRLLELLEEKRLAVITQAVTKGLDPDAPMKDSGIPWLGNVPAHWEVMPTRYVARMESGHTPSRNKPEYWVDCDIPWFSLADVWQLRDGTVFQIEDTAEKVSQFGLNNSSARLLPAGTVVLSRTASVGYSAIMSVDMATTQDFVN